MSLFHFITLILLSGQVSNFPTQPAADETQYGWNQNKDGTLNYIIKLTPETANKLARGDTEAKVNLPDYVIPFVTTISLQVGDSPVERIPSEDELKADLNKTKSGTNLSTLKNDLSNDNKFANIDGRSAAPSRIQNINQAGSSAYNVPPGTNNPAISNATTPFSSSVTGNPALVGASPTNPQYGNPTQPNRFKNEPQYPPNTNLTNDRWGNSQSSIAFNDPPSVSNQPLNTFPSSNTQPLNSPFSSPSTAPPFNRGNEGYNNAAVSNLNRVGEPTSSEYPYGSTNGQYPNNTMPIRPSTHPGSNAFPYSNNGGFVSTRSPYSDESQRPDYLLSSNANGMQSGSANLEIARLKNEIDQLKEKELNNRNSRRYVDEEDLTSQQIRELENSARLLLWFQLFSIVLFVACCFLGGSLYRLYNAYRNLRVSSRHAVHLGV